MNPEKIELILNTGSRYITNDEKTHILDYIEYFKSKNNVVESKNIELVFEIERLHSIIKELEKWLEERKDSCNTLDYYRSYKDVLDKLQELKGSDKE